MYRLIEKLHFGRTRLRLVAICACMGGVATLALLVLSPHGSAKAAAYVANDDPNVVAIDIVPTTDPSGWGVPENSRWVNVTIKGGLDQGARVEGQWYGEVIASDDSRIADQNGDTPIVGVSFGVQQPDSSVALKSGHVLEAGTPGSEPSDGDITDALNAAASQDGVKIASLTFTADPVSGEQRVSAVVEASSVGDFVTGHDVVVEAGLSSVPIYVNVVDSTGNTVLAEGFAPMGSTKVEWIDPAFGCVAANCPPPGQSG